MPSGNGMWELGFVKKPAADEILVSKSWERGEIERGEEISRLGF